jgi:hypothetical protein
LRHRDRRNFHRQGRSLDDHRPSSGHICSSVAGSQEDELSSMSHGGEAVGRKNSAFRISLHSFEHPREPAFGLG